MRLADDGVRTNRPLFVGLTVVPIDLYSQVICYNVYLAKLQVFIKHIQIILTFQVRYKVRKWPSNPPMFTEKAAFCYIFCVLNCHVFGADDYRKCTK